MKGKLEVYVYKANTYQEAFSVPQVLYCVF